MLKRICLWAIPWLTVAVPWPALAQARQLLFEETFEPSFVLAPPGSGREQAMQQGAGSPPQRTSQRTSPKRSLIPAAQDRYRSLVAGAGPDGSTALQVRYVGNAKGSERIAINLPLQRPVSRARLSFDVRFAPDFDFARGGKLLGLAPRRPVTGGAPRRPDGWSARLSFQPQGGVATYIYDQSVTSRRFGVVKRSRELVFQPGTWHHVSLDLRLNGFAQANGSAMIYVDGALVVNATGVELRGSGLDQAPIQKLLFHTFHGGSNEAYTPRDAEGHPAVVSALFDNILVTTDQQSSR